MKCLLCCEWEKKIKQSKNFTGKFIVRCTNYHISAVKDCVKSDILLKSTKRKDKKNAEEAGETYCGKVILATPQNSAIVNSLNRASVKEKESLHKLFEIAYLFDCKKKKTVYRLSWLNRIRKTSRREIWRYLR